MAQQERIVDSLLTPGEVTVEALSADDGNVVATVVARSDRVDIISHGLAPNDTEDQTYVIWGIDDDGTESHRHLRRNRVTDDAADRRLRLDRSRRVRPVRDQPRARSGGSVGTDGHRRERVGGQLSGQETVAPPDRHDAPGDRGRAARPLRLRRDAQPAGARRRDALAASAGRPPLGQPQLPDLRRRRRRADRRPRSGHHPAARPRLAHRHRRPVRARLRVHLGRAAAGVHEEARQALDGLGHPPGPLGAAAARRWRRRPSSTGSSWSPSTSPECPTGCQGGSRSGADGLAQSRASGRLAQW